MIMAEFQPRYGKNKTQSLEDLFSAQIAIAKLPGCVAPKPSHVQEFNPKRSSKGLAAKKKGRCRTILKRFTLNAPRVIFTHYA
jgi:hypothetical protein